MVHQLQLLHQHRQNITKIPDKAVVSALKCETSPGTLFLGSEYFPDTISKDNLNFLNGIKPKEGLTLFFSYLTKD